MKRILVTAAGGAPAINFVQSLRDGISISTSSFERMKTLEIINKIYEFISN